MKICPHCSAAYSNPSVFCPKDRARLVEIDDTDSDPLIGSAMAGRYIIKKKLGQGGMGAVYEAVHNRMDRPCAIKVMATGQENNESLTERFKREAKLASQINNPHAVTIHDFGETENGMLYLVMELIEGQSLRQTLHSESRLEVSRVSNIVRQMAEALSAAHDRGIIHRDLKPDNIMLTRMGDQPDYVKILDFGIAKAINEENIEKLTRTGFPIGTPLYMSCEQLQGRQVDQRSDVYSFALIAYEMLSGKLPLKIDSLPAVISQRLNDDPIPLRAFLPSISPSLEQAVLSGLEADPSRRPQTARAFAQSFCQAADNRLVTTALALPEPVMANVSPPPTAPSPSVVTPSDKGAPTPETRIAAQPHRSLQRKGLLRPVSRNAPN
jgi:serine/threonine-protein kinase